MKISIIMPTKNRPDMIVRAIEGIRNQAYQDWELIIQNCGDSLVDIIPIDPRIKLFEEPDTGITNAMNKGLAKATGDIFNWQNDDDCMTPETLQIVINQITDHKWLYGYILMTDGVNSHSWGQPWNGLKNLIDGNHVPQPSVFWTRQAYEEIGDMDETEDLTSDYEYWLRLAKHYPPLFIDRIMAFYYIHPNQITQTHMAEQMAQARRTAAKYEI